MSVIAYLGLGSNLADPLTQLQQAHSAIVALSDVSEIGFSSFYQSPPLGPADQPDYVNAVMAIATTLAPLDLLHALQAIEQQQGRVRNGTRWGARTLDLDVLLYGEQLINLPQLSVPHPEIAHRAFVLYPLQEIAPTLQLPVLGSIENLIAACPLAGLIKLT